MKKSSLVFILSFLGLLVALYLTYEYLTFSQINCPLSGGGCDKVRLSRYSSFFGISTPLLGVFYYLFMMLLTFVHSHIGMKLVKKLAFLSASLAVLFGVYLTYLEAFVIKAYCFYCVTSFIISLLILLVLVFPDKRKVLDEI